MIDSKQKKLLIITDTFWPCIGGIENATRSLIAHLPALIQCNILTHSPQSNSVTLYKYYSSCAPKPQNDPAGHTINCLKSSFLKRICLLPLLLWDLPGIKRIFPAPLLFDILYIFYKWSYFTDVKNYLKHSDLIHSFSTGWLARLSGEICMKFSIPIIHSPAVHFSKWGDSPAQLSTYVNGNALICFTEMMKREFFSRIAVCHERCHVIPPVINMDNVILSNTCSALRQSINEPGIKQSVNRLVDDPYILFLARREKHKGLQLLIDAFCKITSPIKLVIAGPGDKYTGGNLSIIDFGSISDEIKAALLLHCEVFALPSTDESFGIVYTEAMSYGKPVVAINIEPVNEIVINGITGILVEPDNTDTLCSALRKLLTDHTLRTSMGQKAHEVFQRNFAPEVVIPRITRVYNQCLIESTRQTA